MGFFSLPKLAYEYDALEPHIDAKTMEIHHSKHHQTYINNINAALEKTGYTPSSENVDDLVASIGKVPEDLKVAVMNQAGGHSNHSLFWSVMSPSGGGNPEGKLAAAIDAELGGMDKFKEAFTAAAVSKFGSGWAWLSVNSDKKLVVESTGNQDSPFAHGNIPVLGLDVWEHAYYLKYQNRRPEYIGAFYNVVDWKAVGARYEAALSAAKL